MSKLNLCEAGHETHDSVLVDTKIGKMWAFDWDKYKGFAGYCSGQDDISRTLINTGLWEPAETTVVERILQKGDRDLVVYDVGAHTGWYSIMAAKMGYSVHAIEADPENTRLLRNNASENNISIADIEAPQITIYEFWIDKKSPPITNLGEVELLIIDIEGNDDHAVRMFGELFEERKVNHAMIEISPCFNDRYPTMVNFILSCGYKAYYIGEKLSEFDGKYDTPQFNLLFVKEEYEDSSLMA